MSKIRSLHLADPQYGLDGVASLGIGDRPVDVAEVVEFQEAVEGKLPCPVQLDQFRDKMLRHGIALDDAEGFPSFGERVRPALAGKKRHNAMRIQHLNGEPVHLRAASGLHHVIDATTGDTGDAGGDILTAIVDLVGGAQLQGELEPFGFKVDTDNRAGADDAGRHDRCQAHRPRAEDRDARPL